ncbi:cupin domain-containing protein [Streptomyces goshikiensis]|uniref:cupin domain-containing protein n=1 Tax=Streptomyces goshikiensis TaxID=1942 RepID=UPI0022F3FB9B|nr:cupin domain-containing protein [Streptomyces goshikiensis]WBY20090.1 cupin domain-containing protein [Streptomyces goshikiensis]
MSSHEKSPEVVSGLSHLIAPVEPKAFLCDYWEQKPLHIERDAPDHYGDLLTLDDVDQLLMMAGPGFETIRVVVNGEETSIEAMAQRGPHGRANTLEAIYDHYRRGSTIVLNSLDDRWAPLQRLTHALGAELSAGFQVNVYLTPAGKAQGFKPHYDTHDVLVAQVHGSKQWRLYGAPYELPLAGRPKFGDEIGGDAAPEQELTLKRGDFLYLPRGVVHAATSNDEASVHLTIGVHSLRWANVLQSAMEKLFDEDVRFRQGIPAGFAHDEDLQRGAVESLRKLVGVLQDGLSAERVIEETVTQAVSVNSPSLVGHLLDLERVRHLTPSTPVRRRPGVVSHTAVTDTQVTVAFHNKSVALPRQVEREVRWLARHPGGAFSAADMPGRLDQPGRMLLLQTFLREGLLTF